MASFQLDAEAIANVQVAGSDRIAIVYDSATHTMKIKDQAGNVFPLVSGVSSVTNADGTLTLSGSTGAVTLSLAAAYKSRSDNWFNNGFFNVADNGISTSNSAAANVTAWNALMAAATDNATIYFPASTSAYQFASTLAIPSGRHVRVVGGGNEKTIIQTTSATADIFSVGDWYNEFLGLKFISSVTRSAGAAILSGNNISVNVRDCDFAAMFNGIVFTGGVNAGNLALVDNCHFTNTVNFSIQLDGTNANTIITNCTGDCSSPAVAHVEVNSCGSLLMSNCDWIRATNNIRFNPDSGTKGVFSVYCSQIFFDTAAGSSVKFMGGATGTNIQRIKFVSCWGSGSVIGYEFAAVTSTNKPTAIDFVACDIYSNSSIGILATEVQDFTMSNCHVAGNATAGVRINPAAGAATKVNFQTNIFGPTAGIGANGIGIDIVAGAYGSINITGNNVAGNTSNNNIIVAAGVTVPTPDLLKIGDNLGHLLKGALASQGATPLSVPITTETLVLSARIPANAVMVGQVFRIKVIGVMSAANAITYRCRAGTLGTTGDTIAWTAVASAVGAANGRHGCEIYVTVRSIGAGGTIQAEGIQYSESAAAVSWSSTVVAVAATAAVATSGVWFLDVTLSQTIGTSLIQQAVIEAL